MAPSWNRRAPAVCLPQTTRPLHPAQAPRPSQPHSRPKTGGQQFAPHPEKTELLSTNPRFHPVALDNNPPLNVRRHRSRNANLRSSSLMEHAPPYQCGLARISVPDLSVDHFSVIVHSKPSVLQSPWHERHRQPGCAGTKAEFQPLPGPKTGGQQSAPASDKTELLPTNPYFSGEALGNNC